MAYPKIRGSKATYEEYSPIAFLTDKAPISSNAFPCVRLEGDGNALHFDIQTEAA